MKYILHIIDLRSENPWDNKAVYLLYTELITGNNDSILLSYLTLKSTCSKCGRCGGLMIFPDCPTIPISLGLPQFCLKILNPDQYAIRIGKMLIVTSVLSFSSNSHNTYCTKTRNCVYLTLISKETKQEISNKIENLYVEPHKVMQIRQPAQCNVLLWKTSTKWPSICQTFLTEIVISEH